MLNSIYQYLCLDASKAAQNMSVENIPEKICNTFGEGKCPYDDYCYDHPDVKGRACIKCQSGCKKEDWHGSIYEFRFDDDYEKCPKSHTYYEMRYDACTWKNNCPVNSNVSDPKNFTIKYDENYEKELY